MTLRWIRLRFQQPQGERGKDKPEGRERRRWEEGKALNEERFSPPLY